MNEFVFVLACAAGFLAGVAVTLVAQQIAFRVILRRRRNWRGRK